MYWEMPTITARLLVQSRNRCNADGAGASGIGFRFIETSAISKWQPEREAWSTRSNGTQKLPARTHRVRVEPYCRSNR